MTPEQKIIELAKMDGWTNVYQSKAWSSHTFPYLGEHKDIKPSPTLGGFNHVPLYTISYDAIIPLIQKQLLVMSETKKAEFGNIICGVAGSFTSIQLSALRKPPSELADALLKAKGFEV